METLSGCCGEWGLGIANDGMNSGAKTSRPLAARVRREISRSVRLESEEGDRRVE